MPPWWAHGTAMVDLWCFEVGSIVCRWCCHARSMVHTWRHGRLMVLLWWVDSGGSMEGPRCLHGWSKMLPKRFRGWSMVHPWQVHEGSIVWGGPWLVRRGSTVLSWLVRRAFNFHFAFVKAPVYSHPDSWKLPRDSTKKLSRAEYRGYGSGWSLSVVV